MMDDPNIQNRIAVKLLLVGLVVACSAFGALALAPVIDQADGAGHAGGSDSRLAFPINNATGGLGYQVLSLDGKDNDPFPSAYSVHDYTAAFPINNYTMAFPINNDTAALSNDGDTAAFTDDESDTGAPWDVTGTDENSDSWLGSAGATAQVFAADGPIDSPSQDMDPY